MAVGLSQFGNYLFNATCRAFHTGKTYMNKCLHLAGIEILKLPLCRMVVHTVKFTTDWACYTYRVIMFYVNIHPVEFIITFNTINIRGSVKCNRF